MPSFVDFLKKNAGDVGKLGGALIGAEALSSLAQGESGLKVMLKALKDVALWTVSWNAAMAGAFLAMGKGIRSLVHDTGSLEAALKKLRQIQGLQKLFEPLVGGAKAAKLEIAKLVNFAASNNLKLGAVAEAARSLKIMTRGAYDGATALKTMADAAAGTGSDIVTMSDAVGEFSNTLRSGGSIAGASEKLRQLGAISQGTADQLDQLQQNGASAGQIFSTLTGALGTFSGQADKAKDSLDGVNAAYEAAAANLQEKFGSPFSESDIKNTENWTAAMNGIAPVVERVSGVFGILFNGFSGAASGLAKMVGQSDRATATIEGLAYAFTALVAAASAFGAVSVSIWLLGLSAAIKSLTAATLISTGATGGLATAIGYLGIAVRVAASATGIGLLLAVLGTCVGVYLNFRAATERATKAMDDLRKAHDEANSKIEKQSQAVKTLTQHHDALTAALEQQLAAQVELNNARAAAEPRAGARGYNEGQARIQEAERNLNHADKNAAAEASRNTGDLTPSDEAQQAIRDQVEREEDTRKQKFQQDFGQANPEDRAAMTMDEFNRNSSRAKMGATGEAARLQFSKEAGASKDEVTGTKSKMDQAQAQLDAIKATGEKSLSENGFYGTDNSILRTGAEGQLAEAKAAHEAALKKQEGLGLDAAPGTSTRLSAEARKVDREGGDSSAIKLEAERARNIESKRKDYELGASQNAADIDVMNREIEAAQTRQNAELMIANLKEEGFARTQKEADIALGRIAEEIRLEGAKGKGRTDPAKINTLQMEAANIDRNKRLEAEQRATETARVQSENRISKFQERGYALEDATTAARLEAIYDEYRLEMQKDKEGRGDPNKRLALNTEQNKIVTGQRNALEARAQSGIGTGMDLALQDAQLKGDTGKAREIENFGIGKQKYDEMFAQTGDAGKSREVARRFSDNAISLSAMQTNSNMNSAVRGDSLSRVFGGGNVAAGEGNSAMNVQQQQKKALENIDKYITLIYKEGQNAGKTPLQP